MEERNEGKNMKWRERERERERKRESGRWKLERGRTGGGRGKNLRRAEMEGKKVRKT